MIYLKLFFAFLQIGMFSFGGGYAAMPLIQHQVVDTYHWLDGKGFADLVTISQMTPGPIATNAATFVGMNTAGLAGALIATFGCILPSCILVTFIAYFYLKYQKLAALQGILSSLRPAVIALIASAGISILVSAFWNGQTVIRLPDTDWGNSALRQRQVELQKTVPWILRPDCESTWKNYRQNNRKGK